MGPLFLGGGADPALPFSIGVGPMLSYLMDGVDMGPHGVH